MKGWTTSKRFQFNFPIELQLVKSFESVVVMCCVISFQVLHSFFQYTAMLKKQGASRRLYHDVISCWLSIEGYIDHHLACFRCYNINTNLLNIFLLHQNTRRNKEDEFNWIQILRCSKCFDTFQYQYRATFKLGFKVWRVILNFYEVILIGTVVSTTCKVISP